MYNLFWKNKLEFQGKLSVITPRPNLQQNNTERRGRKLMLFPLNQYLFKIKSSNLDPKINKRIVYNGYLLECD